MKSYKFVYTCSEHSLMYRGIILLNCTPGTNITVTFCANYTPNLKKHCKGNKWPVNSLTKDYNWGKLYISENQRGKSGEISFGKWRHSKSFIYTG